MIILGLDTSTGTASGALIENGRLIQEEVRGAGDKPASGLSFPARRTNHAETLLPLVESLFKNTHCSWQQIGALAVSIGPGSFTGLRIGLSTVKGLAYGWNVPLVGIPTLLAIASRVSNWNGLICPMLDARKKEVYTALFRRSEDEGFVRLVEDLVCSPNSILERSRQSGSGNCLFIGDGSAVYESLIRDHWGDQGVLTYGEDYPSIAFAVAWLAVERVEKGEFDSPDLLAPVYLRPSEAEFMKRPR